MLRLMVVAMAAVLLAGCDDRFPDYRYKMTIYVSTPDGEMAFSSVRQVWVEERAAIQDSSGKRIDRELEGEAVILDLPSGPVFALLSVPSDGNSLGDDYGKKVPHAALLPYVSKAALDSWRHGENKSGDPVADDAAVFQEMVKVQGPRDLPRSRPNPDPYRRDQPQTLWPMFVSFGDINDPMSVRKTSPDEIGVKRITIEIVDDAATTGIRERLPWLAKLHGRSLTGGITAGGSPYGLGAGDFERRVK